MIGRKLSAVSTQLPALSNEEADILFLADC